MLYWECKRRLVNLLRFRSLGADYFSNVEPRSWMSVGPPEGNETARKARREMNLILKDVVQSIDLIGIPRIVHYTPPPAIGGFAGPVDLITSVFQVWQFHIEPQMCADVLDRAIGEYQGMEGKLRRNLFNLFYWLWLGFTNLLGIPFRILGAAGFNARAMEQTIGGKVAKAILGFVSLIAGLLTILYRLGFTPTWEHLSGLVRHR